MNISEVLKNTSYDTSMFSDSAIKAIEDNVFLKEVRGKDVPHITCLIRKKPKNECSNLRPLFEPQPN